MDEKFYRRKKPGRSLPRGSLYRYFTRGRVWKIAAVLMLVAYILFGSRGVIQRVNLEFQKEQMIEKVQSANRETQDLRTALEKVSGDDEFVEKIARERYGMIRSGDTVYRIAEE